MFLALAVIFFIAFFAFIVIAPAASNPDIFGHDVVRNEPLHYLQVNGGSAVLIP